MGLGAIDYALRGPRQPRLLVVTDIDAARLARAQELYPPAEAAKRGVELVYANTKDMPDVPAALMRLNGGKGYDDAFVYAPVVALIEQADKILAYDGCLNFFAGPTETEFHARLNFYNAHYSATHIACNSGGNTADLIEALDRMSRGVLDPSAMITHVGGLDSVVDTTLTLPKIPGGKKLIYTHISLPLTAITDFERLGAEGDAMFAGLAEITSTTKGLWCFGAERLLLEKAPKI
jgi:threonine dehydrogenase-like Zn-dependent dehydrogenase